SSLNESLPNLPIARILSTKRGSWRALLDDGRAVELADARSAWTLVNGADNGLTSEARDRARAEGALQTALTAYRASGDAAYAGSQGGRIWVSRDRGATWGAPQQVVMGAVVNFFIDPEAPRAALATVSGTGAHVLRTVNAGVVWDDITGNLADVAVT